MMYNISRIAHEIIAEDWLEKVVEHTTPGGQRRKVKVKSLPPEERAKYKPKKEDSKDDDTASRKKTIEEIKSEKPTGWLGKMKHKLRKTLELSNMDQQKEKIYDDLDDKGFSRYENDNLIFKDVKVMDKGKPVDLSPEKKKKLEDAGVLLDFEKYVKKLKEIDDDMEELAKAARIEKLVFEIISSGRL